MRAKITITTSLNPQIAKDLETVSNLTGRNKASIIEDALQRFLYQYRNENGEIAPKKGEYSTEPIPGSMVRESVPCYVLANKTMLGVPYKTIYDGTGIVKVPADQVEEFE